MPHDWSSAPAAAWIVVACWVVFFLYWIVSAFRVKRTVERAGGWWWRIVTLAVLAFFFSRRGGVLAPIGGSRILIPRSAASEVTACILTVAGLAIALWARTILGRNWSGLVVFKEGHELIQRGPYHYVRHPIYSGLLLMLLGTVVLLGRASGFVLLALVFVGLLIKARMEERLMTSHFPNEYPAYRRRVKALIPFVI